MLRYDNPSSRSRRHFAGLRQIDAANERRESRFVQTGAAAIGTYILFQKFLDALHALVVLDFRQGIFHRIDGIVIGEIHFARHLRSFALVQNMLLDGRSVIDDFFFFGRQILERHIGTHAHGAAYVDHQRPHQGVPRSDSALVDCQILIGNQRRFIDRHHRAYASALLACAAAVERQLFRRRGKKVRTALRTDDFATCRHVERRRAVVSVGAAMARQTGIHQAQAVEQLRARAERAANAGHPRSLPQGDGGRHVEYIVEVGFRRLRDTAAGIGR